MYVLSHLLIITLGAKKCCTVKIFRNSSAQSVHGRIISFWFCRNSFAGMTPFSKPPPNQSYPRRRVSSPLFS